MKVLTLKFNWKKEKEIPNATQCLLSINNDKLNKTYIVRVVVGGDDNTADIM